MPKKIKKIISIIGVGGGVNPMMENSIMFLLFFLNPSLSTIFFRHPVFCFTAVLPHFEDKDLITNAMHYGTGYLRLGYAL